MRSWQRWAVIGALLTGAVLGPLIAASAATTVSFAWSTTDVTTTLPPCDVAVCQWVLDVNEVRPDVHFGPGTATATRGQVAAITVAFSPACGVIQADVVKNGRSAGGQQHTVPCVPSSTTTTTTTPPPTVPPSTTPPLPPTTTSTSTTTPPCPCGCVGAKCGANLTPQQQQIVLGVAPNGEVITAGNG